MTTNDERPGGVRLTNWIAGVAAGLALAAAAGAANTYQTVARLDVRVQVLERDDVLQKAATATIPSQLARLEAQMAALQGDVARVNQKLDEKRR